MDKRERRRRRRIVGVPYRTLRWEWMIRLASSGVKSSTLGLSWWSDMAANRRMDHHKEKQTNQGSGRRQGETIERVGCVSIIVWRYASDSLSQAGQAACSVECGMSGQLCGDRIRSGFPPEVRRWNPASCPSAAIEFDAEIVKGGVV